MVIRARMTSGDGTWMLNELSRLMDAIPAVTVKRVDAATLEIDSNDVARSAEIRQLAEERLDGMSPSWRQHLAIAER